MKISAVQCLGCYDVIYSRSRYDFHWCGCESVAIDGGLDYKKLSTKTGARIKHLEIEVDATEKQLFDDWNKQTDKFGRIGSPMPGGGGVYPIPGIGFR